MNKDFYRILQFRNNNGSIVNLSESSIEKMNINEYLHNICDHKGVYKSNYDYLNEVYFGNIPDDVLKCYKLDPLNDLVLENMNTHDSDLFVKKMFEYFPLIKKGVDESIRKDDEIRFIEIRIPYHFWNKYLIKRLIDSDRFKNFVDFFGYSISKVYKDSGCYCVMFDSKFTKNVNNKVYDECHGILYHVCTTENATKVISVGLRMKDVGRLKRYRDFPKRVYFHAFPPYKKNILQNEDYVKQILNFISDSNQISILKVDVRNLNINFYEDSAAKRDGFDNAVFAYCNIPPERIKVFYEGDAKSIMNYYIKYGS